MTNPFFPYPPPTRPAAINAPGVVLWIIGLTIGAHLFRLVAPQDWVESMLVYCVFNPADLAYFSQEPIIVGSRWIGHALVHAGWFHLLVNCAFLLAFGTPIARQIPPYSFVALYLLGTAGGAWMVALSYGDQMLFLVGASGGVSALVGALSRMVLLRRGIEIVPHPFSNRHAGMIFIGIFFATNLLFLILPGPGGDIVSGEAHIGGFLAGFVLSLVLPWRARRKGYPAND